MNLSILDYIIIVIVITPFVTGLFKGFMRMLFGLSGMVGGVVLSIVFTRPIGVFLSNLLGFSDLFIGKLLAFILIFLLCGILGSVGGWFARKMMETVKLGLVDRFFGGVFGFFQGTIVVCVLLTICYLLPFSRPWLEESKLGTELVRGVVIAADVLPYDWREYLSPARWIGQSREMILEVLEDDRPLS
ncbi:CvpA family protein [bacterium]|nr:CvpA family protein [bacterium]